MVSRSIHSAMMIYSAHRHTQRGRKTDTDTQMCMHKQHIHGMYTEDAAISKY